jgi:TPR repeat protein
MQSHSAPSSSERISALTLRAMSAADWERIMRSGPPIVALYVRSAAEHGFRTAQVTWGQMLLDGNGTAPDPAAALRWFARAAAAGSPEGINMVGRCHELGWGVPVDHAEAAAWYRKAAARGSDWGAYNLGCMLLYGEGLDRDMTACLLWFRRAAGLGNPKAMGMLGRASEEGWGGTSPDPAGARDWYRCGAQAGDCWAAFNLGSSLVADGAGLEDAAGWFRRSLDLGTPNFFAVASEELLARSEPELRAIGRDALRRSPAAGAGRDAPAYRASRVGLLLRRLGKR